jgi:hypothetical protein
MPHKEAVADGERHIFNECRCGRQNRRPPFCTKARDHRHVFALQFTAFVLDAFKIVMPKLLTSSESAKFDPLPGLYHWSFVYVFGLNYERGNRLCGLVSLFGPQPLFWTVSKSGCRNCCCLRKAQNFTRCPDCACPILKNAAQRRSPSQVSSAMPSSRSARGCFSTQDPRLCRSSHSSPLTLA